MNETPSCNKQLQIQPKNTPCNFPKMCLGLSGRLEHWKCWSGPDEFGSVHWYSINFRFSLQPSHKKGRKPWKQNVQSLQNSRYTFRSGFDPPFLYPNPHRRTFGSCWRASSLEAATSSCDRTCLRGSRKWMLFFLLIENAVYVKTLFFTKHLQIGVCPQID